MGFLITFRTLASPSVSAKRAPHGIPMHNWTCTNNPVVTFGLIFRYMETGARPKNDRTSGLVCFHNGPDAAAAETREPSGT